MLSGSQRPNEYLFPGDIRMNFDIHTPNDTTPRVLYFHYLPRRGLSSYYGHNQVVSQLHKRYVEVKVCPIRNNDCKIFVLIVLIICFPPRAVSFVDVLYVSSLKKKNPYRKNNFERHCPKSILIMGTYSCLILPGSSLEGFCSNKLCAFLLSYADHVTFNLPKAFTFTSIQRSYF
jgi:hypothetical protein